MGITEPLVPEKVLINSKVLKKTSKISNIFFQKSAKTCKGGNLNDKFKKNLKTANIKKQLNFVLIKFENYSMTKRNFL